jgi:hypothetical protein
MLYGVENGAGGVERFKRSTSFRKFIFPFCWFSWFRGAGLRRTLKSRQMEKPQMGKPK